MSCSAHLLMPKHHHFATHNLQSADDRKIFFLGVQLSLTEP
jgi:hypothetical protein